MNKKSTSTIIFRITKIIILIFILPAILIGLFGAFVLISSKTMGVPSFLDLSIIEISNDNFYNEETQMFATSEFYSFKSLQPSDYKSGDIIAFYSGSEENEDAIQIQNWTWDSENGIESLNSFSEINANLLRIKNFNNTSITNMQTPFLSAEALSNNTPYISLGKIAKTGKATDINNNVYHCFSIYDSLTDTNDENIILGIDIIGVYTETPKFIIDTLVFCSSTVSVILLLIPCILLLFLNVINITSKVKKDKEDRQKLKSILLTEADQPDEKMLQTKSMKNKPDLAKSIELESRQEILKVLKRNKEKHSKMDKLEKIKNEFDLTDDDE